MKIVGQEIGFCRAIRAVLAALLLCSLWATQAAGDSRFTTVEWLDLIPAKDLKALENPPAYIAGIKEGSAEDAYQQALVSTIVNEELNGQGIRIPGFVVPLEFDEDLLVTQFLLVPYFGACIHVPAPPPNQIILVNASKGFRLDALYQPFWVSGVVTTSVMESDLATTAYVLDMKEFELYDE